MVTPQSRRARNRTSLSITAATIPPMQHRESGFTAQYDSGTCTNCRSPIEAGQEIANSGYGGEVTRYHHAPFCPGAHITCSICGQNWYECDCP